MPNILLAGYFGCGNLGDDAIMLGYMDAVSRVLPGADFAILSGSPEYTSRYYNVRGYNRKDVRAVNQAITEADALIFPGGSIFQDVTSFRSVVYYRDLVRRAKKAGKKVLLLGQGVGPVTTYFGKKFTAEAFNNADLVSLRDPASLTTLQALGVKRPMSITADSAFLLPPAPETQEESGFAVGDMKSIGISARPFGKGKAVVDLFSELCLLLVKSQMMPVLIEMDRNEDGPLIDAIEKTYGGRISHLRKIDTPSTFQQRIARMDGLIAMRLHAGILGSMAGVPPFVVSYDPKTLAFSRLMGLDVPPSIEGLTAQRLFDLFMSHQKSRERNRQVVARHVVEMTALAQGNVTMTLQAFGHQPAGTM